MHILIDAQGPQHVEKYEKYYDSFNIQVDTECSEYANNQWIDFIHF